MHSKSYTSEDELFDENITERGSFLCHRTGLYAKIDIYENFLTVQTLSLQCLYFVRGRSSIG